MNTFDNTEFPNKEELQQQAPGETPVQQSEEKVPAFQSQQPLPQSAPTQEQSTYRNAGVGRRESPFANAPYMTYDQGYRAPTPAQFYNQPVQQTVRQSVEQPVPQPKKPRKKHSFWKTALAAVLVLALVVGSCLTTAAIVNNRWESRASQMTEEYSQQFAVLEQQFAALEQQISANTTGNSVSGSAVSSVEGLTPSQVYARNVDAVVMVHCEIVYSSYGQSATGTSTGSGFITSEDGYVLTNYHVVEGATSVSVSTHDGVSYSAQVIGYDDTNDVALLKMNASGLPFVTIGSSDDLIVGDQVVAIGNPLGELTSTMTVGYVSGKERAVTTDGTTINMIQTDAAINSGNSGGPLFNMKGEVIGITTAKYSGSSSSGASIEGIGFAIPIDDIVGIVDELMEFGYIKSAYMGVMVKEMNEEMQAMAELYNLPVGLYVDSVEPDGPAFTAGIQAEDIITKLGDTRVMGITELTRALREYEPGDTTTVTVFRAGAELVLTITLTEKPQETGTDEETAQPQPGTDMPTDGSYEEWYEYFFPFFGSRPND